MKRKIASIMLSFSLIFSSILYPLELKAETQSKTSQSVEWNGTTCSYQVILPDGYGENGLKYPVVYIMPQDGYSADSSQLTETMLETMKGDSGMDMIIVCPTFTSAMDVRSVMEAIVTDVDAKYATIPDAAHRAVMGVGTGGYLAYIVGFTDTPSESETIALEESATDTFSIETEATVDPVSAETVSNPEETVSDETTSDSDEITSDETTSDPDEPASDKTTSDPDEPASDVTTSDPDEPASDVKSSDSDGADSDETVADSDASVSAATFSTEKATTYVTGKSIIASKYLTEPKLFKSIASIRGDFVSSSNPWYTTYGDVYNYLRSIYDEGNTKFYENFYTYMDAPSNDSWTNMLHSTNDLGSLFISWNKSISFDYHEFTIRSGSFSGEFLNESLRRVVNRFTDRFTSGLISGTISLEKVALTSKDDTATIQYSVKVNDNFTSYFDGTKTDIDITISVIDPNSKETLHEITLKEEVSGPGTYTGKADILNVVNGSSSTVKLSATLLGVKKELGTAKLIRIQDTGTADDEQQIDLMGDWYFNYVGRTDPYIADALTQAEFETWSVVQPALGNWEAGFGNITKVWYMNTGWGWYARTFDLPEDFTKENLTLIIGYLDDRGEVFVNGHRVGGTGVHEDGSSTGETTWAVLSKFSIDSSILNYGGTNTIYVHCYNDPPYGGGGWYSGPVGLYSQAAYNKLQGLPSKIPEKTVKDAVIDAVKLQTSALADGDFDTYGKTIADDYFSSGTGKNAQIEEASKSYPAGTIKNIEDTEISVYETTGSKDEPLYLYSALRKITYTDDTSKEIKFQDTYIARNNIIYMYGNHSRFYEVSYESSLAASASGETGTREEKYLVYLPEGYFDTDRYYPTVYLLHQYNSDHTSYMTDNVDQLLDQAMAEGLTDDMIVVIPNSSEVSFWRGDWERMVTEELIPLIDSNYRTIKDSRYRLTAGASMGGQGAYGVALRNPDLFSGAISFFGAFSMGGENSPNVIVDQVSSEYLNYYTLYFMCGNQDLYGFGVPAIELDKKLTEKGVDHYFFIENGDHNSEFYIPYFKSAFSYTRNNMYQSDDNLEKQLEGYAKVETDGGKTIVTGTVKALDGITSYFNSVPSSLYTKNENPPLSIPVILSVIQDGQTVYSSVERDYNIQNAGEEQFSYDISSYINSNEDYEIIWKAAVLDRVVELEQITVAVEKDPETDPEKTPGPDGEGTNSSASNIPSLSATTTPTVSQASTQNPSSAAKTSDENPVNFYGILFAASLVGITVAYKKRKKA